jgi:hypothetical protein
MCRRTMRALHFCAAITSPRSYCTNYPRLVRAMQGVRKLNGIEAAACICDLKAGRRWSSEAVNRYGGTHKVATEAWKYRRAISLLPGRVA